jgi:hypothetical protein
MGLFNTRQKFGNSSFFTNLSWHSGWSFSLDNSSGSWLFDLGMLWMGWENGWDSIFLNDASLVPLKSK